MAYEMHNIDGLMRGAGRLKQHGFNIEWGVGRHGPGDNVFSYFIEPNGFVAEYTTEVEQVDEAIYVANTPEYWAAYPMRPCRWGMATQPSNRVRFAMSGKLAAGEQPEDETLRCDDVIARKLGATEPRPARRLSLGRRADVKSRSITNYGRFPWKSRPAREVVRILPEATHNGAKSRQARVVLSLVIREGRGRSLR